MSTVAEDKDIKHWVDLACARRRARERWENMTPEEFERARFFAGPPLGEHGLNPDCVYPVIEAMWWRIQELTQERDTLRYWIKDTP